jgi:hypothetical protein
MFPVRTKPFNNVQPQGSVQTQANAHYQISAKTQGSVQTQRSQDLPGMKKLEEFINSMVKDPPEPIPHATH